MAQGYSCDNEDGQVAVVLVTNLSNGDTMALCASCWPTMARAMADAMEGGTEQGEMMDDTVTDPEVAAVVANGEAAPVRQPKSRGKPPEAAEAPSESPEASAPTSVD